MNDHHLNLLQSEIDGLNSEAESDKVKALIESDSEVRAAFEELQAVKIAIASLVQVEPPATLKESIMNAIPQPERTPESAGSVWSRISEMVRVPRPITLAYAFTLGVVVAFVVSSVIVPKAGPGSVNVDQITGTMAFTQGSGFQTIAEYAIEDDEKKGKVRVARKEREIVIEFIWDGDGEFEARVLYDEAWADVSGTYIGSGYNNRRMVEEEEGEVIISGSGSGSEYVNFQEREVRPDEESELEIEVNSDNRNLFRRSLLVRRKGM